MVRTFLASLVGVTCLLIASAAQGQAGDGGLQGFVKDEQGGVLPGVTVTATGTALLAPVAVVTDNEGLYRLINLPPGTVAVAAQLDGFATFRREGILVRAGSTYNLDINMKLGSLEETITVSGASPMIEVGNPTSTLHITGDLLVAAPLTSRRLWSDVLDMIPAMSSRQLSGLDMGKRAYYFLGATIFGNSFSIDGAPAQAYTDGGGHSMDLGGDAVADVQMKVGGVDAASPLSTGVVVNVVTQRGGNTYKGSASYTYQALSWNANNAVAGGLPSLQGIKETDLSLGGPVLPNKLGIIAALRYADLDNGISRTATDLASLLTVRSNFTPFNNFSKSYQPFVKLTAQFAKNHQFSGFYQRDRSRFLQNQARDADSIRWGATGGSMVAGRLNSIWTNQLTSEVSASWNNKHGADEDTYKDAAGSGPSILVHQDAFLSRGLPTGTGVLATLGNVPSLDIRKGHMVVFRGDLSYYRSGLLGSHEFKTGIWAAPSLHYDVISQNVNNGFVLEEVRFITPTNPGAGTVPFHRQYQLVTSQQTVQARDRDVGVYIQDAWKPIPRVTLNAGVRADFVKRHDALFNVDRQKSVDVGPRLGMTYAMSDQRTVFRVSYARVHEQVNGRDPITLLGSPITSGGSVVVQSSRLPVRDLYDANGDGTFETQVDTPASGSRLYNVEFAPHLHQPYLDEFVVGLRRQFAGQTSLDVSAMRRYYKDRWDVVDINGFYPDAPFQAFGGFGRVDPNRGIFYQEQNGTWNTQVITALQAVITKDLKNNMQFVVGLNRQWQRVDGTWNPTDPARFIQPDAFQNDKEIGHINGNDDYNSLDGRGSAVGAAWRPYSVRVVARYFAPGDIQIGGSYVIQTGDYSGPILTRLAAADPRFGPATVVLGNGTTQPNPLATTIRFAFPTRGEGQVRNETSRYLQLTLARKFKLRGSQEFEPTLNVFNVFNSGALEQYLAGSNQLYNPNYLLGTNQHPPRSVSVRVGYRF